MSEELRSRCVSSVRTWHLSSSWEEYHSQSKTDVSEYLGDRRAVEVCSRKNRSLLGVCKSPSGVFPASVLVVRGERYSFYRRSV